MSSEKEIIISFLFKRSGKAELKFSDLYLALSMELNWFTPDDAKYFISLSVEENLLTKKEDILKPNFDFEKTIIPIGFTPSKQVFEIKKDTKQSEKLESVLEKIIKILDGKIDFEKTEITKKIDNLAKQKNITKELAALHIGKEFNINFEELYDKIEDSIFKE